MEVIVFPWPHPSMFPNAKRRLHWSKYQPHCNCARRDGEIMGRMFLPAHMYIAIFPDAPIPLRITFYPLDKRRRDDDGMIGAFKHYRDGIADGLGIDDRLFRPQYVIAEPCAPGRVEVEILA